MEHDFGNAMVYLSQSWNWLENKKGKDDEISRSIWKAMETEAEKARMAEVEGER